MFNNCLTVILSNNWLQNPVSITPYKLLLNWDIRITQIYITRHYLIQYKYNIQTDPSGGCLEWTAMRDNASIVLQKSPWKRENKALDESVATTSQIQLNDTKKKIPHRQQVPMQGLVSRKVLHLTRHIINRSIRTRVFPGNCTAMVLTIEHKASTCNRQKQTQKFAIAKTNKTVKPWFSLLLQHPARKWSRPILVTSESGTWDGGILSCKSWTQIN